MFRSNQDLDQLVLTGQTALGKQTCNRIDLYASSDAPRRMRTSMLSNIKVQELLGEQWACLMDEYVVSSI